jgi:hypothetical protein
VRAAPGGVAVTFIVIENPIVTKITFDGNTHVSSDILTALMSATSFVEHAKGLTDTGRITEENLQPAPALVFFFGLDLAKNLLRIASHYADIRHGKPPHLLSLSHSENESPTRRPLGRVPGGHRPIHALVGLALRLSSPAEGPEIVVRTRLPGPAGL